MKISKEKAEQNREKIIDTASKLFRERGFDGVGVAELMREAGFTHGGFYGHFESKEALMLAACQRAFDQSRESWEGQNLGDQPVPLKTLADQYSKRGHRDSPGKGCPIAALAVDVAGQREVIRSAFTENVKSSVELVAAAISDCSKSEAKRKAIAAWSMLVGSMILARAVNDAKLSDQILEVGAKFTGEL